MADFDNLFSVEGKVALVTGGSRGLGEMIARRPSGEGRQSLYFLAKGGCLRGDGDAAVGPLRGHLPSPFPPTCRVSRARPAWPTDSRGTRNASTFSSTMLAPPGVRRWKNSPRAAGTRSWTRNVKGVFFLTQKLLPRLRAAAKNETLRGSSISAPSTGSNPRRSTPFPTAHPRRRCII